MSESQERTTTMSSSRTIEPEIRIRQVLGHVFKIKNVHSAFYGEEFLLVQRVPWRDGSVSLWLESMTDPSLPQLSFDSTDCEYVKTLREE